jgi:hypothetical protein
MPARKPKIVQTSAGPLARLDGWEMRLHAYLQERIGEAFHYGRHDCCAFATGAIEACTGVDVMAEVRGKYKDARGAAKAMRKLGGTDVETAAVAIATRYRMPELATVLLAQRGDVVLVESGQGPALGVLDFDGRHVLVPAEARVVRLPLGDGRRAWRV